MALGFLTWSGTVVPSCLMRCLILFQMMSMMEKKTLAYEDQGSIDDYMNTQEISDDSEEDSNSDDTEDSDSESQI